MGNSHAPVVTLANSIVGVSVLAMPFCFKQCGILLATLMLLASALITRTVCYFLLKSSFITRRRSYELLAYHTLGRGGKFVVEISMIGFLLGTLVAFLVVMGDLGPQIVASIFKIENNGSLRSVVMSALALFVALPLALLRDIDSLSSVSTASFLFYGVLVIKILTEGLKPDYDTIEIWRPAGVLQCIPIIAMALSCQTQIFSIYESLPEPSLPKMNSIVGRAVNICTLFYILVGFFGYVAIGGTSGNILLNLTSSWSTDMIKCGFVMSIVFSFPLCVFPCRASLYSLLFRGSPHAHPLQETHMPDQTIRLLTVGIVGVTLVIGLLIPNIELVLGLVGSTAGALVCIIFPSILFLKVTEGKATTERLMAKFLLSVGLVILCLTTYVTLYAVEQAETGHKDLELQHRHVDAVDLNRLEFQLLKVTSEKSDPLNLKEKGNSKKPVSQEPIVPQHFLDTLKQQQVEQQKLIEEQKSILEQLQVHANDHKKEYEQHHRPSENIKKVEAQIPQKTVPDNNVDKKHDVVEKVRESVKEPETVLENIPKTFTSKKPDRVNHIDDNDRVHKPPMADIVHKPEAKKRDDVAKSVPETQAIHEDHKKAYVKKDEHVKGENHETIVRSHDNANAELANNIKETGKVENNVNLENYVPPNAKQEQPVKPNEKDHGNVKADTQPVKIAEKPVEMHLNAEKETSIPKNIQNPPEPDRVKNYVIQSQVPKLKKPQADPLPDVNKVENSVLQKEEIKIQLPIQSEPKQQDIHHKKPVDDVKLKSEIKEKAQAEEEEKNKVLIAQIKKEIKEKFKNENQSQLVKSEKFPVEKGKENVDRDM